MTTPLFKSKLIDVTGIKPTHLDELEKFLGITKQTLEANDSFVRSVVGIAEICDGILDASGNPFKYIRINEWGGLAGSALMELNKRKLARRDTSQRVNLTKALVPLLSVADGRNDDEKIPLSDKVDTLLTKVFTSVHTDI